MKSQIRTKRVGRGRLVTIQAGVKNRTVLLEWVAALAAQISVNKVFNFFLAFRVEESDKRHYDLFSFLYVNAKLNDKV